ncbi:outer membrane beta-barrel protein [Deminuibacter soli]|uniref:TonB-dependent receptor n=1 Tax=Deminuibacter soli TaxID=2291815 RepID=A0A3E1NGE2_9BACT|nr:outer membrane beta-barrel protein [Deminuibacter soli]RFM27019.1 TonB-dependent receptor [Deminuibacter soli]
MKKKIFPFALSILINLVVFTNVSAQLSATLTGNLVDSVNRHPMFLATVALYRSQDSTIINYKLTDDKGHFKFANVPAATPLKLIVTYSGYSVYRRNFTLPAGVTDFGNIVMKPDTIALETVLVLAERPPVIVKKDTIEFNASSFKMLPNAVVEDLFRKLPGMAVDKEGNITANGQRVSKLLVDGREFFGQDPRIASKNLPANIIDKVQVTDDKEEAYMHPNRPSWENGKIINLTLKKGVKQGIFGKAFAGAGTEGRYEAGGLLNMFRDTLQVSAIGFSNNLSRNAGFQSDDLLSIGGFQRSNFNDMNLNADGSVASIDKLSFGGDAGGIQKSTGGGLNINHQLGANTTLNLLYFYNGNSSALDKLSVSQQFLGDSILNVRTHALQDIDSRTHLLSGSLRQQISNFEQLNFKPALYVSNVTSHSFTDISSATNYQQLLNHSVNRETLNGDGLNYSHELSYSNLRLKKAGRSFTVLNRLSLDHNKQDQINSANSDFYSGGDSLYDYLNQLRHTNLPSFSTSVDLTYKEPISKTLSLQFTSTVAYFNEKQQTGAYNFDTQAHSYVERIDSLSLVSHRTGFKTFSTVTLPWQIGQVVFTPGITVQTININNRFGDSAVRQDFQYYRPYATIRWRRFYLGYSSTLKEPDVTSIQPVVNNTNPLFQIKGNPYLKPVKSQTVSLSHNIYKASKLIAYNFRIAATKYTDAIIQQRSVDGDGVQYAMPVNTNGNWTISEMAGITKHLKVGNGNWELIGGAKFNSSFNRNIILVNTLRSEQRLWNISPSAEAGVNWKDLVDVRLSYVLSVYKSRYSDPEFPSLDVTTHGAKLNMTLHLQKHFYFENMLDYQINPLQPAGIKKDNLLWHGAFNYTFLKNNAGILKLSYFDLLNQNTGISRVISQNYILDSQIKLLHRYFMLTFIYNIRNFSQKENKNRSLFNF